VTNFTVLFDACVFYPAPLRDLLLQAAVADLFRAKWTDQIHDDWIRNLLQDRTDLTPAQLMRTRELMNRNVRDCLVTGYESLIDALMLPDPDDRHVLAAAILCGADVIVTFNLQDFPESVLKPLGIEAQHPDDFLTFQLDLAPAIVCGAVKQIRARLSKPSRTAEEYLDTHLGQGLPQTVAALRKFVNLL